MTRTSTLLVAAGLALAAAGCGGDTVTTPDAGTKPDTGSSCAAAKVCGAACCAAGESCVNGACVACGCGSAVCGDDACGNSCGVCGVGSVCSASGQCELTPTCGAGKTKCGSLCCNDATESCSAGSCVPNTTNCTTGTTACGTHCCTAAQSCINAACVDNTTTCTGTQKACGSVCCEANQTCSNGTCTDACAAGRAACNGTCCAAGESCVNNACATVSTCAAGQTACGAACCDDATQTCSASKVCEAKAAGATCDPLAPTACSFSEGCYYDYDKDEYFCMPKGSAAIGDGCAEDKDCVPGGGCFDDGTGAGVCFKYCDPAGASTCTSPETCYDLQDGTGVCVVEAVPCSPFAQGDCTGSGEACYYSEADGGYTCQAKGTVAENGACTAETDCAAGLGCFGNSTSAVCLAYCDPAATNTCLAGACTDLNDGAGFCDPTAVPPCDPVAKTGCTGADACYYDDATQGYACSAAGTTATGGTCTTDANCVPGDGCGSGKCWAYCNPTASTLACSGAGAACNDLGDGYGFCVNNACSALAQDCPTTTDACYPSLFGNTCAAPGAKAAGEVCASNPECAKGLGCFSDGTSKTCYKLCDPAAASPGCATGETCEEVRTGLGVCY